MCIFKWSKADLNLEFSFSETGCLIKAKELGHSYYLSLTMLYIDLQPRQTCHSKDGGSAYSIGVGELGRQYGTGLKSHGTVTN